MANYETLNEINKTSEKYRQVTEGLHTAQNLMAEYMETEWSTLEAPDITEKYNNIVNASNKLDKLHELQLHNLPYKVSMSERTYRKILFDILFAEQAVSRDSLTVGDCANEEETDCFVQLNDIADKISEVLNFML